MFLIKWIRFLLGTVSFEAEGGFVGRFINLCHLLKIPLWNISSDSEKIKAQTSIKGYKNIRKAAHKSAVRPHVIKKEGLPFILHGNRIRVGILIGLILSLLLYAVGNSCIWRIEVAGNERIGSDELLYAVEQAGLVRGLRKKDFTARAIEQYLTDTMPSVAWASANIKGSTVSVEIREQKEAPAILDDATPTNIVASHDGYIQQLDLQSGTAVAVNYTAVAKGDLIFSGIVTKKDGTFYAVHAKGACYARTKRVIEGKYSADSYRQVENLAERKILYFFGLEIPLHKKFDGSCCVSGEKDLGSTESLLPIGVKTECSYDILQSSDRQEADCRFLLGCSDFYEAYRELDGHAQILAEELTENKQESIQLIYRAECYEDIAEEKSFEFDFLITYEESE